MNSIRHSYEKELEHLRSDILEMGKLVETAIAKAVQSLSEKDVKMAQEVMAGDDRIDQMEVEIDDKCMVLIARQQPLARDLRIVGTSLKITTDLERMGDHAYDIAKITVRLGNQPLIKPLMDIPRMADMGLKMLRESLEAYVSLDIALAEAVCLADDDVDVLYQQVLRELLTYMIENPKNVGAASQLLFVARYLERIADHATNIAEWIIYLETGERLRKK